MAITLQNSVGITCQSKNLKHQKMGSRALLMLNNFKFKNSFSFASSSKPFFLVKNNPKIRSFSTKTWSSLQPPDVPRLAETARISLAPNEVEEFAPKIRQMIDWFGQLQAVDLDSVEPAVRVDTEGDHLREDVPETFENKEALIGSVPSYEKPYIKVPKVLNKE